ncbi:Pkinase-domain-containing protein [Piromyces finnis]|uniref:non-specific serine/threonine protein kinase n=1 Tax=Piromyces finnis TaxID=1754191 RepID=A0A1Y1VEI8_9FUNG|nr:Pkinase-domain-containing protein [Piromyces finnis]|eukprot:ORX53396.1 Pkinase-domain-containing protein [Piromyces finnis]
MLTDDPSFSSVVEDKNTDAEKNAKKRSSRTIFGSYQLLRTIGEGEFGKVKLGLKINTQSAVAIKLIKKKNVFNQNKLTKLCQEISILEKVNHPFIIKTYEVIEDNDYIGIIMEYASGGELFEYILAHRYLEEYEAKRFFAQLLSGINYLHKNHLVHRDLKLENLLLDSIHNIVITDFGFATESHSDENKFLTTSCGSPCYAAPELVVNDGYVGEAADIWSCGVILYAMICGYLPFDDDPNNPDGENIHLLYKYILETEVSFPDYVSEEAKSLLRGILNPDPDTRFKMDQIINHPWLIDFKEFILLEYDDNNEAIIPECEDMPENMKIMVDNNMNNVKTLASQVFSSVSSSNSQQELKNLNENDEQISIQNNTGNDDDNNNDNESNSDSDEEDSEEVSDDDSENDNNNDYFMDTQNVLPDVSTIDTDQYIDFIKQSDCDTTSNINSEASDINGQIVIKKDSYYTAQGMDLNQNSSVMNESHVDEDFDIPMDVSIPMNTKHNYGGDSVTIPDSISNYYTDSSEIFSTPLPSKSINSKISHSTYLSSTSEINEHHSIEQSNKTVTDKKETEKENQTDDIILPGSLNEDISPIYSSILENSIEELPSTVNNQSKIAFNRTSLQPKPRVSSLPENNIVLTSLEDEKASSILSQTVVEAPTQVSDMPETLSTVIVENKSSEELSKQSIQLNIIKENEDEVDKESESEYITKLETLSINSNKEQSFLKEYSIISNNKSIVSDRKSIRSKTDINQMNLENIKISRSNISLSSKRLSICTTTTLNNTSFLSTGGGNNKKMSAGGVNTSMNDISMDGLHPLVGHTSLILPHESYSSDMKRYSLNAYKKNRNSLVIPTTNTSMINSFNTTTTSSKQHPRNSIINNNVSVSLSDNKIIPQEDEKDKFEEKKEEPLMILDELKEDKELSVVKPSSASHLHLEEAENSSTSEIEHPPKTEENTEITSMPVHATESKVDGIEASASTQQEENKPAEVKPAKELISPKNPYIKFFNGIIDSKALTITPPFVTFLEMQKTLIDMDIDFRVLNNCFKIRCQKSFNNIDSPEDLEAIAKASPVMSPLHSPINTPSSTPSPQLPAKTKYINKSKKSLNDEVITTASPRIKANNTEQVSKCYSFHSYSSGKFKSIVNSLICAKPSSPSTPNQSHGNDQKRLFSLIKRKKTQSHVIFTMEICRIKNRDELYIIKFKRRKGDVWLFKDLYQQIIARLPLRT